MATQAAPGRFFSIERLCDALERFEPQPLSFRVVQPVASHTKAAERDPFSLPGLQGPLEKPEVVPGALDVFLFDVAR